MRSAAGCNLVFTLVLDVTNAYKNTEKSSDFEIVMIFRCFGVHGSILVLYLKMRRSRPILQKFWMLVFQVHVRLWILNVVQ